MDAYEKYISDRLRFRQGTSDKLSSIKREFYEARLASILGTLGFNIDLANRTNLSEQLRDQGVRIVTIRTSFDQSSKLLKPVATLPESQMTVAEGLAHNHKPQRFWTYDEATSGIGLKSKSNEPAGSLKFSALYQVQGENYAPSKEDADSFGRRIETAIDKMRSIDRAAFKGELDCFFSVSASRTSARTKFGVRRILAIYFTRGHEISKTALASAHSLCTALFDEIDQIQSVDNELFKLEGHELVSSLQSTFLDDEVAPADKIAFAVEKLKSLLQRHLESHYPTSKGGKVQPEVYFVTIAYDALEDKFNHFTYRPSLQVYPHVYRAKHALPSFHISHPSRISVSKLLLQRYLKHHQGSRQKTNNGRQETTNSFILGGAALLNRDPQTIDLNEQFMEGLFSDYEPMVERSVKGQAKSISFSASYDRIFASLPENASTQAREFWSDLNVAVKGTDRSNSSILAYIIEGREFRRNGDSWRQLPRAILAIEGQREELFSEQEQRSLRVVAKAFANLIRHVFHDNSLLDYRPQLSKAYRQFLANATGPTQYQEQFLLASMAVDVERLQQIKNEMKNTDPQLLPKGFDKLFESVFSGTEASDDEMTESEVKARIRDRSRRAMRYVKDSMSSDWDLPIDAETVSFIEACPRNFAWSGYAPSLTQALGDRADQLPPKFELMTPGYSASGLYMAIVKSELQQVAKLSSLRKLKIERDNYRKFIRYKILLAARTPSNALAFDSQGKLGQSVGEQGKETLEVPDRADYEKSCYGVLVSDLASSRTLSGGQTGEVATFQERAWAAISDQTLETLRSVVASIGGLFGNNLGHWFNTDVMLSPDSQYQHLMISSFRLDFRSSEDKDATVGPDNIRKYGIKSNFEKLLILEDGARSLAAKDAEQSISYVDINKISFAPENLEKLATLQYTPNFSYQRQEHLNELLSIIHGDMNSRNLVWAGPIEHFVMIDFEHVRVGLWGIDQARLAVNTIVDHIGGSSRIFSDGPIGQPKTNILQSQIPAIEDAANFLLDEIFNPKVYANTNFEAEILTGEDANKRLTIIVKSVLLSSSDFFRKQVERDSFDEQTWIPVYKNSLILSLVKEYEYALKNLSRAGLSHSEIELLVSSYEDEKVSLHDWLTSLFCESRFGSPATSIEMLNAVSRYAITFWIINSIFDRRIELEA